MATKKKAANVATKPKKTAPEKKTASGSNWSEQHQSNVVVHKKDESEQE